jgi:hypothetical protein
MGAVDLVLANLGMVVSGALGAVCFLSLLSSFNPETYLLIIVLY